MELAEPDDQEDKEDKQALRESLRLERVADEEEARLENENLARLSRVENLLQRVRTEMTDGVNANDKVEDKEPVGLGTKKDEAKVSETSGMSKTATDPNTHECQKCSQHLPEASIELWEHYTNHYKSAILRFCQ